MELISKILFGIANSLLIPDIILLIILFVRAIMLAGSFYGQFITNRKNMAKLQPMIDKLKDHDTQALVDLLPKRNNAPVIPYMRDILEHGADEDFAEYTIANFEILVTKDLTVSRLLAKMGPVLGLVGTLIAMSCPRGAFDRRYRWYGLQHAGRVCDNRRRSRHQCRRTHHTPIQTEMVCQGCE